MRTTFSKPGAELARHATFLVEADAALKEKQDGARRVLAGRPDRATCANCGADLAGAAGFDHRGVAFVACPRCTHVQTRLSPPPGYPMTGEQGQSFDAIYSDADKARFLERVEGIQRPKLDWVLGCADLLGTTADGLLARNWLEIGCGAGQFLMALENAGCRTAHGLDADPALARRAGAMLQHARAEAFAGGAAEAVRTYAAEVYAAWFVLEHVDDLSAFWQAIAETPPGTLLAVAVPTFGFAAMLEGAVDSHYARSLDGVFHTQMFTDESLAHGLHAAGCRPVAQWVFGQDAMDLQRLLSVSLAGTYPPAFLAPLAARLAEAVDGVQAALDKALLADARHVLAVRV